jgi:sigma-E factor negative regulatory protein RseC
MKNIAYVKEISGENAVLKIRRECACSLMERCGTKCFTLADEIIETEVYNSIGAKAGDYVEVEGNAPVVLIYASLVFMLPVFIGLILYFTAFFFINNIAAPYIIAGIGFVLAVIFLYRIMNKLAAKRNLSDLKITKIINVIGEDNG